MIKMSIGAAFSETFAFLKANWMQMLLWVGGALVVVGFVTRGRHGVVELAHRPAIEGRS